MPRLRENRFISLTTGEEEVSFEVVPENATFSQRFAELKASVPADADETLARIAYLTCNGCGKVAELDFDYPELPEGWRETSDGDFCPGCC